MAEKAAKGNQGKRYSAEEKAEIFKFIKEFNAENKRGGMKAASEKFGVSAVTLSNWGKKTKAPKKRKALAKIKKAAARKAVSAKATPVQSDIENPDDVLARLQAIRSEIVALEKEYNSLKKKL